MTSRCGGLLPAASADARSSDDVIAFEGWTNVFSQAVFQVGDSVAIRKMPNLDVVVCATITAIEGSITHLPVYLTLGDGGGENCGGGKAAAATLEVGAMLISSGDVVEPLSAVPRSVQISNNTFSNSRASGIILMANNAEVQNNLIENVSSAAIDAGGYWQSFSEAPFGSNVTVANNRIHWPARGHRTVTGGAWGAGAAMRFGGTNAAQNTTELHRNISVTGNVVNTTSGMLAVQAVAVDGLQIRGNVFCLHGASANTNASAAFHCRNVVDVGNGGC